MTDDLILLVEDDPDDEELALAALRQHKVGRVVSVHDGVEALEFLEAAASANPDTTGYPRLILMDLKMPRLDGVETLKRIRSNPQTALIPVVIMTSSKEDRDLARSYMTGANSYIRKSIDFDEFREAMRQLTLYWLGLNQTARY
jgi:two-component system response regulator